MLPLRNIDSRFPIPEWEEVAATASNLADADAHAFWTERGREWVHQLRQALGSGYIGYESTHFWLISSQPESISRRFIPWLETTRTKVLKALELDVSAHLYGKCPVLVTHDLETYYDYVSGYLEEGEHALSGGMYINQGYGHFVFTYLDMGQAELVLAHELTHSLVAHLPLPAWVNEGIAQLCEQAATGRDTADYEQIRETLETYWTAETIQDLWTGQGFNRQDEGQFQSYHLAKVLTGKLAGEASRFQAFLHEAHFADAGSKALMKHFGLSLEELVTDYLGEGNWSALPTTPDVPPKEK
ncbi:MAG: peptidase superfamily protein [Rariglobus sp.]|jgi:hypothetical protein|nr:peptidase superfamily protein [Rariglobus sp.]